MLKDKNNAAKIDRNNADIKVSEVDTDEDEDSDSVFNITATKGMIAVGIVFIIIICVFYMYTRVSYLPQLGLNNADMSCLNDLALSNDSGAKLAGIIAMASGSIITGDDHTKLLESITVRSFKESLKDPEADHYTVNEFTRQAKKLTTKTSLNGTQTTTPTTSTTPTLSTSASTTPGTTTFTDTIKNALSSVSTTINKLTDDQDNMTKKNEEGNAPKGDLFGSVPTDAS